MFYRKQKCSQLQLQHVLLNFPHKSNALCDRVTSFLFIGVNSSGEQGEVELVGDARFKVFCADVRYLLSTAGNKGV